MSKKYMLRIVFVTILVVMTINLVFVFNMRSNDKQKFEEIGERFTTGATEALRLWTGDQIRVLDSIAKDQRIIDMCLEPQNEEKIGIAEKYLKEIHEAYSYYENLPIGIKLDKAITREVNGENVTIENGTFLVDTVEGITVGKGGMEYSYITEIFDGKIHYISEIYPSILRGKPIYVISAPVVNDGEIIGVAIISPQMDYFSEVFIDQMRLGKTGYMFFLDEAGEIIAHPNRELILSTDEEIKNLSKGLVRGVIDGNRSFSYFFEGVEKYCYWTEVNFECAHFERKGYIFYSQTIKEIYTNSGRFTQLMIVTAFMSAVFLGSTVLIMTDVHNKELHKKQLIKMNLKLEETVESRTKDLRKMAITDGLTSLYNHQYVHEMLGKIIELNVSKNKSIVLMIGDLDDFKNVNDTYGHPVGDEVLKDVSKVFLNNIRTNDIAGRYGGEEFILILVDCSIEHAQKIAERIRSEIEQKKYSIEDLKTTISIGITAWENESSVELIKRVDRLLYIAKGKGKNRIEVG